MKLHTTHTHTHNTQDWILNLSPCIIRVLLFDCVLAWWVHHWAVLCPRLYEEEYDGLYELEPVCVLQARGCTRYRRAEPWRDAELVWRPQNRPCNDPLYAVSSHPAYPKQVNMLSSIFLSHFASSLLLTFIPVTVSQLLPFSFTIPHLPPTTPNLSNLQSSLATSP